MKFGKFRKIKMSYLNSLLIMASYNLMIVDWNLSILCGTFYASKQKFHLSSSTK